jgi:hypothetical protein
MVRIATCNLENLDDRPGAEPSLQGVGDTPAAWSEAAYGAGDTSQWRNLDHAGHRAGRVRASRRRPRIGPCRTGPADGTVLLRGRGGGRRRSGPMEVACG